MIRIFNDVLIINFYISTLIIIVLALRKKVLNKYTSIFNYILCIGITLRLIFITRIRIPIPKILKIFQSDTTLYYGSDFISPNNNKINFLQILCLIWIIGMIITSIYYIYNYFNLYKNVINLKKCITDYYIYNVLEVQKSNLKIRKNINIYKLDGIYSPMIVGFFNPQIIIPNRDYTYNNLHYIFKHELIHYKRKDNLIKLILTFVTIIYWFNPIIYLLKNHLLNQCELSCDELVVQNFTKNEVKEYSLLLLDTIKYKNKLNSQMCVSYLNESKSNITKIRISHILSFEKHKKGTIAIILIGLVIMSSTVSFHSKDISTNTSLMPTINLYKDNTIQATFD
ncbi:M56 family metallopeptidase [Paraclostridium sordellii]